MTIGGVTIIESLAMVDGPFEDWTRVRSHGRARRRRFKHRQNIQQIYKPSKNVMRMPNGVIVCHPITAGLLRQAIRNQTNDLSR